MVVEHLKRELMEEEIHLKKEHMIMVILSSRNY